MCQAVPPLQKLAMDTIVRGEGDSWGDIPRTLQDKLMLLQKDYMEIQRWKWDPCNSWN